jgi:hypothetical protein
MVAVRVSPIEEKKADSDGDDARKNEGKENLPDDPDGCFVWFHESGYRVGSDEKPTAHAKSGSDPVHGLMKKESIP